MGVKAGYKRTEVGVIPEEWEVSTVGREFDIQLGKMLDAEKNVGIAKPYLGNKSVQWGRVDTTELQTMRMSPADLQRFRLCRGDLLVCEGGEVGRAALWEDQLPECYYQKALHRLRPLNGFDSRLMVACLRFWVDHEKLGDFVSQTSIAHLTKEKFSQVPMAVPPRGEQRAIATALSDVDALLTQLDRLIAKKRDIKQAAMQQLLTGKTRLPGFGGEWQGIRLREIGTFRTGPFGSALHKSDYTFDGVPVINPMHIIDGRLVPTESMSVTESAAQGLSEFRLRENDLVIGRRGEMGRCAVVKRDNDGWLCGTGSMIVRTIGSVDPSYLQRVLASPSVVSAIEESSVGSTMINLNQRILGSIAVQLPALEEQTAIATLLSDLDAELAALEARRDKTRALKQGMMQELLTGRTRLI